MGWTHVEPKNIQGLNKTTFLATYAAGILAEEIGAAIEKIENWLGKPEVITCNDIMVAQLPHVLECVQRIMGLESVVLTVEWMISILIPYRMFRVVTTAMQPAQLCWGHWSQQF